MNFLTITSLLSLQETFHFGCFYQARKMFEARNPAGRFGRADEVAMLAVYLASDEVSDINK